MKKQNICIKSAVWNNLIINSSFPGRRQIHIFNITLFLWGNKYGETLLFTKLLPLYTLIVLVNSLLFSLVLNWNYQFYVSMLSNKNSVICLVQNYSNTISLVVFQFILLYTIVSSFDTKMSAVSVTTTGSRKWWWRLICGLSYGYIFFKKGRPWWFVRYIEVLQLKLMLPRMKNIVRPRSTTWKCVLNL